LRGGEDDNEDNGGLLQSSGHGSSSGSADLQFLFFS